MLLGQKETVLDGLACFHITYILPTAPGQLVLPDVLTACTSPIVDKNLLEVGMWFPQWKFLDVLPNIIGKKGEKFWFSEGGCYFYTEILLSHIIVTSKRGNSGNVFPVFYLILQCSLLADPAAEKLTHLRFLVFHCRSWNPNLVLVSPDGFPCNTPEHSEDVLVHEEERKSDNVHYLPGRHSWAEMVIIALVK